MYSNTTPSSRHNKTRSRGSVTPQEDPNLGFAQFSQQPPYIPQFENSNFAFQHAPISTQVPYNFSYDGLLKQGFQPATFVWNREVLESEDEEMSQQQQGDKGAPGSH